MLSDPEQNARTIYLRGAVVHRLVRGRLSTVLRAKDRGGSTSSLAESGLSPDQSPRPWSGLAAMGYAYGLTTIRPSARPEASSAMASGT